MTRVASRPPVSAPVAIVVTAAVYFLAGKLGLSLAYTARHVTVVWPPTGIALAAVLLLGRRVAPGIALGAFLVNWTATPPEPLATALGIAAGNTFEAIAGAWMLERAGFRPGLARLRDVLALLVLAVVATTAMSATLGVTALCLGGTHPWDAFGHLWWLWWIGDALGNLVVAPLLLVWASAPSLRARKMVKLEPVALLAGVVLASALAFRLRLGGPLGGYPFHYAILWLVIVAAMRFGQRGTTTTTIVASAIAIWTTLHGAGPFVAAEPEQSLVQLQLYMAAVAVTGLLLGAAIAERDDAERRAADDYESLQMSEERLRLALDAGHMGVWDWNLETGAVTWAAHLEAMFGLAPGSFGGTRDAFLALVHEVDRPDLERVMGEAMERGGSHQVAYRVPWPDGTVRWLASSGRVLHSPAGRPARMLGVTIDITEDRRLRADLHERASALADADRRKDEFLAMLAHELRNPLAAVSTALHLLRADVPQRQRWLDMAGRQTKQLARLVDDLLDVSRITQGKITLRKERVVVGEVVARAVEMVHAEAEARAQRLTVEVGAEPVEVEADPVRLSQVVANLLSNAVKFTPRHGIIAVAVERGADAVAIRVRDSGVGLSTDLLPRIFDLFVQGEGSLDRRTGGLGIGLTVVRHVTEMHGGRVEARSDGPGRGSEFVVHLPLAATAARERPLDGRGAAGEPPRRLRVLVVEDNADTADGLATVLRLWGHEVRLAASGPAALESVEGATPDVILSDLGLPGMDGYRLARALRRDPACGKAALVALSGYGRDEDRRHAIEAGFDHHLVKPPDLDALAALLASVAERGDPPGTRR